MLPRPKPSMAMAMVDLRVMRMRVHQPRVPMRVGMRLIAVQALAVLVRMMRVVNVTVLVLHGLVDMRVFAPIVTSIGRLVASTAALAVR